MATAVEPGSQPRTPAPPASLLLASAIGAVYVAAALAVAFRFLPTFWAEYAAPRAGYYGRPVLPVSQIVVFLGLVWVGRRLLLDNAPKGVHGGVFLVISAAVTVFFLWRALALNVGEGVGQIVAGVFAAVLVFFAFRFLSGPTGTGWMVALEEQGWFSTAGYKSSLGQKARRLTILGILLLGGTGIYSLWVARTLPENWALALPFENPGSVTVLPDAQSMVPGLLLALTLWVAFRAVNIPSFAEFLIATEAEMNKVSWTPKRRLAQDTVVVLTTTLIMVLFLLVVDLFWGALLSHRWVGVLPAPKDDKGKTVQAKQEW
ncbi:MAG: preprotein translocase subunit SecE [Isosphaera sp.]|nr:preprotein translocase subunit SecE [Isosphaera sp.]